MNRKLPCLTLEHGIWTRGQSSAEHRNGFRTGKAEGTRLLSSPNLSPPNLPKLMKEEQALRSAAQLETKSQKGERVGGRQTRRGPRPCGCFELGTALLGVVSCPVLTRAQHVNCDKESDGNIMPEITLHLNWGWTATQPEIQQIQQRDHGAGQIHWTMPHIVDARGILVTQASVFPSKSPGTRVGGASRKSMSVSLRDHFQICIRITETSQPWETKMVFGGIF